MIRKFFKEGIVISVLLTVLRIYLGLQWIQFGLEKITSHFSALTFLKGAIAQSVGQNPPVPSWYAYFVKSFAIPHVAVFNFLVPWGELLVGIGIMTGIFTTFSLCVGMFLNLNYLMSGALSANNPMMLTMEIILFAGGYQSARFGIGHLLSYIKNRAVSRSFVTETSISN